MPHRKFANYSRKEPARTILFVVASFTVLAGILIFTPYYVPSATGPALTALFAWSVWVGGAVNISVGLVAIRLAVRNKFKSLAHGSMTMFVWWVFVSITRLLAGPEGNLTWISPLIVAIIMSILYLNQSYEARIDDE